MRIAYGGSCRWSAGWPNDELNPVFHDPLGFLERVQRITSPFTGSDQVWLDEHGVLVDMYAVRDATHAERLIVSAIGTVCARAAIDKGFVR